MKRPHSCIPVIWCLLLTMGVLHCALPGSAEKSTDTVNGELAMNVDQYLTRITPFGFSGAALVAKGDQILLNKGYGLAVVADTLANSAQTVFSVGSITKQFTAVAVMKLEMMGKLKTGNAIAEYFDDVPEDKKEITLHHLLTHTSGLTGALGDDFEAVGRHEMMQRILESELEFSPGEDFGYSNCGYSMLAAIIEIVSETGYEQFLNEHLFRPAGMQYTGYRLPAWENKNVAHWYDGDVDNGIPLDKDYPYWNYVGNGGILSTTDDMFQWHRALMGDKILSAEAKTKLYTPFLNDYAYGWDVLDTEGG
ncbi:MAG: beta-lactamase family protein, partial [Candidatus Zixiibacteriota bacterium]